MSKKQSTRLKIDSDSPLTSLRLQFRQIIKNDSCKDKQEGEQGRVEERKREIFSEACKARAEFYQIT
jgi:hypothetical protein